MCRGSKNYHSFCASMRYCIREAVSTVCPKQWDFEISRRVFEWIHKTLISPENQYRNVLFNHTNNIVSLPNHQQLNVFQFISCVYSVLNWEMRGNVWIAEMSILPAELRCHSLYAMTYLNKKSIRLYVFNARECLIKCRILPFSRKFILHIIICFLSN